MVGKRLLSVRTAPSAQRALNHMLLTLCRGGYATLDPAPPPDSDGTKDYRPELAVATPRLDRLLAFRGINPLYGDFLSGLLPKGSRSERIQALESVLELSGAVARAVPVPDARRLDPGPLETSCLDPELARLGLAAGTESTLREELMEAGPGPTLAAKLRLVFGGRLPQVTQLRVRPIWAAGDLLDPGGQLQPVRPQPRPGQAGGDSVSPHAPVGAAVRRILRAPGLGSRLRPGSGESGGHAAPKLPPDRPREHRPVSGARWSGSWSDAWSGDFPVAEQERRFLTAELQRNVNRQPRGRTLRRRSRVREEQTQLNRAA